MRINEELIQRCSSRHLLPQSPNDHPLRRLTHLYLQEQHIRKIENLDSCINLLALYLYENRIERIENLECLTQLSCLYLQDNSITRIENLGILKHLTVLNLSHNCIAKLEGLEQLCELQELYVQFQTLLENQAFEFDSVTIASLSGSLRVLNVSGNGLRTLQPLTGLARLESLQADDNHLAELVDLVRAARGWPVLRHARLVGNPVCRLRKYRDSLTVACLELEELDSKVISQQYRNFLLNWRQCQSLQDRKKESYALLEPFLAAQMGNKQLTPPRATRSASVSRPGRSGSLSSSQSDSSVRTENRSRSAMRVRSLQDMIWRRSKDP